MTYSNTNNRPCTCGCPFFFFNDTATTEIYTLSLHDALPISGRRPRGQPGADRARLGGAPRRARSEEHTSELQSRENLVCSLLLEKKKKLQGILMSWNEKNINGKTQKIED